MSLLPRRRLPVLMYHRFGPVPTGDPALWITAAAFDRQLQWLGAQGYRTLTLDEAFAALTDPTPPSRSVLLTIDDGFVPDLERAAAILGAHAARATVFVPAGLVGHRVELHHPGGDRTLSTTGRVADRNQLENWLAQGLDVGSHALSHVDLTSLSPTELQAEVADSKDRLEQLLQRPIRDLCYPFARHDAAVRRETAAAGYRAAYAGEPPHDDLFAVPRMMVYPHDDLDRFRRKVSGHYYWLSAWHQKLRRFVGN